MPRNPRGWSELVSCKVIQPNDKSAPKNPCPGRILCWRTHTLQAKWIIQVSGTISLECTSPFQSSCGDGNWTCKFCCVQGHKKGRSCLNFSSQNPGGIILSLVNYKLCLAPFRAGLSLISTISQICQPTHHMNLHWSLVAWDFFNGEHNQLTIYSPCVTIYPSSTICTAIKAQPRLSLLFFEKTFLCSSAKLCLLQLYWVLVILKSDFIKTFCKSR